MRANCGLMAHVNFLCAIKMIMKMRNRTHTRTHVSCVSLAEKQWEEEEAWRIAASRHPVLLDAVRQNFCCTENIRALLCDFAPVKNRYCLSPPKWRSSWRSGSSARIFGQSFSTYRFIKRSASACSTRLWLFDSFFLVATTYELTQVVFLKINFIHYGCILIFTVSTENLQCTLRIL